MVASLTLQSNNRPTGGDTNITNSWQDCSRRPLYNNSSSSSSTSTPPDLGMERSSGDGRNSSPQQQQHRRLSSMEKIYSTDAAHHRKRPRSEDARDRHQSNSSGESDRSGANRSSMKWNGRDGEYSSSTPSQTGASQKMYPNDKVQSASNTSPSRGNWSEQSSSSSSKAKDQKSTSVACTTTNGHKQSERRSSVESTKSTTSSTSSGKNGFRRLKKFATSSPSTQKSASPSSPEKKKKKKKSITSLSTSSSSKKDDNISGFSEEFQQAQLRLWQAAQERHKKVQEMQEQKQLKKLKKERLSLDPSAALHVKQDKQQNQRDRRDDIVGDDKDNAASMTSPLGNNKTTKVALVQGDGQLDDARARKKLKKLKKKQRLEEAERTLPSSTESSPKSKSTVSLTIGAAQNFPKLRDETPMATTSATSALEPVKSTKKRRLVKMGSNDGNTGRKKKEKISVLDNDDYNLSPNRPDDKSLDRVSNKPKVSKSEWKQSSTKASCDAVGSPLTTPLSYGLADTVKTRVRACTKVKDELELLQASSFEAKKRRKKNKLHPTKEAEGNVGTKHAKKAKKKEKRQPNVGTQVNGEFSRVAHPERSRDLPAQRNKAIPDDEQLYDADVENPRKAKPKAYQLAEASSTRAPSEASSTSETILAGVKPGKKKNLKKFRPERPLTVNSIASATVDEGGFEPRCHRDQLLPFKKRVAAAAAADSCLWERRGASTTASKVSISSMGTGPGATAEFSTEASSISEFTHPLGAALPPPPAASSSNSFPKLSPVPREIVSNGTLSMQQSFHFRVTSHTAALRSTISSSDDSDSDDSTESDTDEEELYSWANRMFGTSAKPEPKSEKDAACAVYEVLLTPEQCEMERRRQKQEEARTLSIKEVNAIMKEEMNNPAPAAEHWVRRSIRQPSMGALNSPLMKRLLDKLRGNDIDMVVLKMKKYLSDPDTPSMLIDAALDALEECTICEALYIQNFNIGMRDKQVLHLLKILQMPSCSIWCLNIGETYNVTEETWEIFTEGLKRTKVTHMYASEHTITSELKDEIRRTIRNNRLKHNMHNDPNNLDVIVQCTHCWWNPINAKVLRPFIRKRGFESLLHDKEAQGLRGSSSEAPVE